MKRNLLFALSALVLCACAKTEAPEAEALVKPKQYKLDVITELSEDVTVHELTYKQKLTLLHLLEPATRMTPVTSIKELNEKLDNWPPRVMLQFWFPDCGPCTLQVAYMSELEHEYAGRWTFLSNNIEYSSEIASIYGVRSLPTLLFFKDGKLVDRLVGYADKAKVASVLQMY